MPEIIRKKPSPYDRIPLGPKAVPGELKVRDISAHFAKLSPDSLKVLELALPKGSVTLQSYKEALRVQEAIRNDNNRINQLPSDFLEAQLHNPFLSKINVSVEGRQVVNGQLAYKIVQNAAGKAAKREGIEVTLSRIQRDRPMGFKPESWNRVIESLRKEALKKVA